MKKRNGFVSNSSSSSFVVAFPRKPTCFEDVYEFMFNSKEGGIQPYDFVDGMSHTQVAQRVWDDIKRYIDKGKRQEWYDDAIPATKDDIVNTFRNRYHYIVSQNVFWMGRKNDEKGGAWESEVGPYYGSDSEALIELRDLIIKTENEEDKIRNRQRDIFNSEFKLQQPPYAYKGGTNHKTGKAYTKKQIAAREAYDDALEKFKKDNKEYAKLEKRLRAIWDSKYDNEDKLRSKLADADAKAFMIDNREAFIFVISYADEDGESTLEHGNIFKNVSHVRISNH